jgi:hypothetical protein
MPEFFCMKVLFSSYILDFQFFVETKSIGSKGACKMLLKFPPNVDDVIEDRSNLVFVCDEFVVKNQLRNVVIERSDLQTSSFQQKNLSK